MQDYTAGGSTGHGHSAVQLMSVPAIAKQDQNHDRIHHAYTPLPVPVSAWDDRGVFRTTWLPSDATS
eukprot:2986131-Rhodomonas_salina.5